MHLADVRAEYPHKKNEVCSSVVSIDGIRQWIAYETLEVHGDDFVDIGKAFENANAVKQSKLGDAVINCMNQRALVDFAVNWIEGNRDH